MRPYLLRRRTMKAKIALLKNFIQDHKVAVTAGVTSAVFILLIMRNQKMLNEFLEKHGLLEEFYALED
jgi:hypothetical protein